MSARRDLTLAILSARESELAATLEHVREQLDAIRDEQRAEELEDDEDDEDATLTELLREGPEGLLRKGPRVLTLPFPATPIEAGSTVRISAQVQRPVRIRGLFIPSHLAHEFIVRGFQVQHPDGHTEALLTEPVPSDVFSEAARGIALDVVLHKHSTATLVIERLPSSPINFRAIASCLSEED